MAYRRSRPLTSTTAPRTASTARRPPEAPTDTGVKAKALCILHRSRSIGWGEATTPGGMATTTVRPSCGPSPAWVKWATPFVIPASWQELVEPNGPAKQAARVKATGAVTRTAAWPMGTSHWFPTAFQ